MNKPGESMDEARQALNDDEVRGRITAVPHWYHRIEVRPGIVTPGTNDTRPLFERLDLPSDCTGLSVLDVGTRDGFFAFELERRGAKVFPIDYAPPGATGFEVAAELLGSRLDYRQMDIYDLSPRLHGTFDIVLFLGVFYHLPDPLRALRLLRTLCRGRMVLETHILDPKGFLLPTGELVPLASVAPVLAEIPILQFYPGDSLCGDYTNYWAPNLVCLQAMLEEAGFRVARQTTLGSRALVECVRGPASPKAPQDRLMRGLSTDPEHDPEA